MFLKTAIVISALLCWGNTLISATHVVSKGDTLYALGRKYNIPVKDILQANPGLDPNHIRIGQKLAIPEPPKPVDYTVKKGDTLSKIGRKHGVTVQQLRDLNHLKSDTIYIGQKLKIPAHSKSKYVFLTSKILKQLNAPRKLRLWRNVIVHHSGTSSGNAKIFGYYHREIVGMENGLAYHFVIGNGTDSGDGEIEVGDRWSKQLQGGHVVGEELNEISIGICLVGNFNQTRPTRKQISALIELVHYLNQENGRTLKFLVHREVNPNHTACPGRHFPAKTLHGVFN